MTLSFCGKESGAVTGSRLPRYPVVSVPAVVPAAPPYDAFDDEEDEADFGGVLPNDVAARCGTGKLADGLNDRAVRGLCAVTSVAGLMRRGPALDVCAGVAQVKCSPRGAPGFERPVVTADTSGHEALAYKIAREEASLAAREYTRHPAAVDGNKFDDVRVPVAASKVPSVSGVGRPSAGASASRTSVTYRTTRGASPYGAVSRPAPAPVGEQKPKFVGWMRTYSPLRRVGCTTVRQDTSAVEKIQQMQREREKQKVLDRKAKEEAARQAERDAFIDQVMLFMLEAPGGAEGEIVSQEVVVRQLPHLMLLCEQLAREKSIASCEKFIATHKTRLHGSYSLYQYAFSS